jgi:hypothetical protein
MSRPVIDAPAAPAVAAINNSLKPGLASLHLFAIVYPWTWWYAPAIGP